MSVEFTQLGPNTYEANADGQTVIVCTRAGQAPEDAWAEAQQPVEPSYRDLRHAAYPAARDQLDAIAKMCLAMREAGALPAVDQSVHDWLDKIEAVKAAYPKPEGGA